MNLKKALLWVAVAAVAVIAVALLLQPKAGSGPLAQAQDVNGAQLRQVVASGARLIDVRTPSEFALGHIQGAVNVPVTDIQTASASWDKNAPVVVYCASGARSLNASQYLSAQGFSHVYNLVGGLGSWDGTLVKGASASAGATTSVAQGSSGPAPPPVSTSGPSGSTGGGASAAGGTTSGGGSVGKGPYTPTMYEFSSNT